MTNVDRFLDVWSASVESTVRNAPRQRSTAVTPEMVTLIAQASRTLAELATGHGDQGALVTEMEDLTVSMRQQVPPTIVDSL
jgi:hypothetical protein